MYRIVCKNYSTRSRHGGLAAVDLDGHNAGCEGDFGKLRSPIWDRGDVQGFEGCLGLGEAGGAIVGVERGGVSGSELFKRRTNVLCCGHHPASGGGATNTAVDTAEYLTPMHA